MFIEQEPRKTICPIINHDETDYSGSINALNEDYKKLYSCPSNIHY